MATVAVVITITVVIIIIIFIGKENFIFKEKLDPVLPYHIICSLVFRFQMPSDEIAVSHNCCFSEELILCWIDIVGGTILYRVFGDRS